MVQSDAELVDRVRQGDIDAFGSLANRYEKTLLAMVLAKLRDIHTAEDVVQATLLLAFRRLETLRDADKFGPWLMQIARRQIVEAVRVQNAVGVPQQVSGFETAETPHLPEWIDDEHLLSLVAQLPQRERLLIGLRYFDGQSMAQIAEILARPVGTVTKQLSRAIARLRSKYGEENEQ